MLRWHAVDDTIAASTVEEQAKVDRLRALLTVAGYPSTGTVLDETLVGYANAYLGTVYSSPQALSLAIDSVLGAVEAKIAAPEKSSVLKDILVAVGVGVLTTVLTGAIVEKLRK